MREARKKGTHTQEEFETLLWEFDNHCVRCAGRFKRLERSHIVPICHGGSDGIDNIQPLCPRCNYVERGKGFNWKEYRIVNGFSTEELEEGIRK